MDERIIMKAEDFSISSMLCREPNLILGKPMIKALNKWLRVQLRMQKKNRRRWGG